MCWELPGGRQGRGNERLVLLRQQAGSVMGISNWHVTHRQRMCAREKGKAQGVLESMPKFCQNLKEMTRKKGKVMIF